VWAPLQAAITGTQPLPADHPAAQANNLAPRLQLLQVRMLMEWTGGGGSGGGNGLLFSNLLAHSPPSATLRPAAEIEI
jgi:hypothetical protein